MKTLFWIFKYIRVNYKLYDRRLRAECNREAREKEEMYLEWIRQRRK